MTLKTLSAYELPLSELSGLGQRVAPDSDALQLVAVADESWSVVLAELAQDLTIAAVDAVDLRSLVGDDFSAKSEWEAADSDRTGRVFILNESPGRVAVLTPGLDEQLHTLHLHIRSSDRALAARIEALDDLDWGVNPNAQGEGLVLLTNGHVLIAKEKAPVRLMEFGPAGETAGGVSGTERARPVSRHDLFPLPDQRDADFELLSFWELDEQAGREIDDVSDVAIGENAELYLLSDESRLIARAEPVLRPEHAELRITATWSLPPEIVQPEGLVITADGHPIVGVDRKDPGSNLYMLSRLR